MSLNFLSIYDYLGFILPGGLVLLSGWYALTDGKYQEPGAFAAIVIGIAAYVLGQGLAAIWDWFEPVAWGHWPFTRVDHTWGLIGGHGTYGCTEGKTVKALFHDRYRDSSFERNYELGYAEIQQAGKGDFLAIMNQQIALFGHLCLACVVGLALVVYGKALKDGKMLGGDTWWVVILLTAGAVLFGLRYRQFWKRFGDQVVRQVRLMASAGVKPALSQ